MPARRTRSIPEGDRALRGMARLNSRHPWSHNDWFHGWVLANLPRRHGAALDVGCGQGELAARLSPYFVSVRANDVDADMRAQAGRRCSGLPNVVVDGDDWSRADGPFDLITMIAVLHHLDEERALHDVRRLLAPGGRFLAVGLVPARTVGDHLWDLVSIATNPVIGFAHHPWVSTQLDVTPRFPVAEPSQPYDDVRQLARSILPGAVVRRRLGFRHTIAWTSAS